MPEVPGCTGVPQTRRRGLDGGRGASNGGREEEPDPSARPKRIGGGRVPLGEFVFVCAFIGEKGLFRKENIIM